MFLDYVRLNNQHNVQYILLQFVSGQKKTWIVLVGTVTGFLGGLCRESLVPGSWIQKNLGELQACQLLQVTIEGPNQTSTAGVLE